MRIWSWKDDNIWTPICSASWTDLHLKLLSGVSSLFSNCIGHIRATNPIGRSHLPPGTGMRSQPVEQTVLWHSFANDVILHWSPSRRFQTWLPKLPSTVLLLTHLRWHLNLHVNLHGVFSQGVQGMRVCRRQTFKKRLEVWHLAIQLTARRLASQGMVGRTAFCLHIASRSCSRKLQQFPWCWHRTSCIQKKNTSNVCFGSPKWSCDVRWWPIMHIHFGENWPI